ncbi:MAG: DUF2092 domain-containing protein [Polyangiales bacterium]
MLAVACFVGGQANAEQPKQNAAAPKAAAPKIEPKAQQVLHDMSEFMSKQRAFEVEVDGSSDAFLENGQKVQLNRESFISVERPNKVRADRKGERADAQIFYDGKTLTVYSRDKNVYAQRPAPPTIDATVSELYDKFDMDLGPGDLLSANPEKTLTEDAVSGQFIGRTVIDDVPTNHIAMKGHEVDWELWVEDGARPLPRKYVITSKKIEGSPQYSVTLSHWKFVADLPDETFMFQPPKDAKKIDFADQVKTRLKKKKE